MGFRATTTLAIALPDAPFGAVRQRSHLGVPYLGQRHVGWCWAACIAMVLRWLTAAAKTQVWQVVERKTGCEGCGDAEPPPGCHGGVPPAELAAVWKQFGVTVEERDFDPESVWVIVSKGRAVEIVFDDKHVALLVGTFLDDDLTKGFLVHDPWQKAAHQPCELDGIDPLDEPGSSSALVVVGMGP